MQHQDGRFLSDHTALLRRYLKGGVNLEEVRRELAAQLRKVEATGVPISHVDSHQHMHTLPGIIDIVLDLAVSARIGAVRAPRTPLWDNGHPAPSATSPWQFDLRRDELGISTKGSYYGDPIVP